MTQPVAPHVTDADLRRYLVARASAVAATAAPADDMAFRVAAELGLVRRRLTGVRRALRVALVVATVAALLAGALYLVGQLRNDDYVPAEPSVTVELHGSPWAIAALDGSVWVAGYDEPVLFEIEPSTGEVLGEIPTGKRTCGELAAAFGYLWMTTCPANAYLSRVDPTTNRVDRLNDYGGDQIGFGDGRVWLVRAGVLEGLDPVTLDTVTQIPVARGGTVTYAFESVWIADADGHVVARVDPRSGRVLAEITWEAPGLGAAPVHMAEAGGALWVVDEEGLGVYRIDPATNQATRTPLDLAFIDGTGWGDHPIVAGPDGLWVRESDMSIARIDPATGQVTERVQTDPLGGGSFLAVDGALWYANLKGDSIVGLQRGETRP